MKDIYTLKSAFETRIMRKIIGAVPKAFWLLEKVKIDV